MTRLNTAMVNTALARATTAVLLAAGLASLAACDNQMTPASGVQFVAANASTVIVDMTRGAEADLDLARVIANQKCSLFGKSSATLESLNVVASNRERASFLCR